MRKTKPTPKAPQNEPKEVRPAKTEIFNVYGWQVKHDAQGGAALNLFLPGGEHWVFPFDPAKREKLHQELAPQSDLIVPEAPKLVVP